MGLYTELKDLILSEQAVAQATIVRGTAHVGAKMLIFPDKTVHGSTGLPALNDLISADAERAIWSADARIFTYTLTDQHFEVFIEGFPPPPELIIVGAGHIAISLTTLAKILHYHVVVVDARSAFANRERFPHADELIVAWPDEVLSKRTLYPSTSVAILTHDPKFDEPTLKVVLARDTGYVGAIGSRKTAIERAVHLQKQGITVEQLQRIHGPIGLDIGASTPEEIALAIMAEIVALRHNKTQNGNKPD